MVKTAEHRFRDDARVLRQIVPLSAQRDREPFFRRHQSRPERHVRTAAVVVSGPLGGAGNTGATPSLRIQSAPELCPARSCEVEMCARMPLLGSDALMLLFSPPSRRVTTK